VDAWGQIKIVSTERFDPDGSEDKSRPKFGLSDLSMNVDFIKNHYTAIRQISDNSELIFAKKNQILTTRIENDKKIVSSYSLTSDKNFQKVNELKFSNSDIIVPFEGGGFAAIERWEGGGNKIQVFSKTFQRLNTFSPFLDGYDYIHVDAKDNLLLFGARSSSGGNPRLELIDENGRQIFVSDVLTKGNISKVLCASKYFIIYCFNQVSLTHEIFVYNKDGNLLWRKNIDGMVENWICNESERPYLAIGSQSELSFIKIETSTLIHQVKLRDLYPEPGVLTKNYYIEMESIGTYNKVETSLLLAEPIAGSYKNIILVTINPFSGSKSNSIDIGQSNYKPILRSSDMILTVIKNNEMIKYGF